MFQRIMVANRGEIALRIIRACREMGIEVVAVYSEADRGAPYLSLANQAICIGPALASESYLNIPRLISAAEIADVQAIHPGYGFLSENAHFAEVCRSCKIEFIGPPHEAMRQLGSKNQARKLAMNSGVKVVPGSEGLIASEEEAVALAGQMGYPVLIKASAGGGGRGMRVAHNDIALKTGLASASQEAESAFKDGSVYMEKYIEQPRHVEVQVIGDQHGNLVHLWERDCSLQRRHQKLVEESPAPHLPTSVREAICAAAIKLVKAANYYSAGTVEFLVDKNNHFYFIEVNTRIQVEHPVTELVTGVDLIKEMIRVAAGEKLSFTQKEIVHRGASFEVRINAEDPAHNFRPSPGKITKWQLPGGPGVRVDTHATAGYTVPSNYDSMVAKLLVHAPDRPQAVARMRRALAEFQVEGIATTLPLLRDIFQNMAFVEGLVDTTFIERTYYNKG